MCYTDVLGILLVFLLRKLVRFGAMLTAFSWGGGVRAVFLVQMTFFLEKKFQHIRETAKRKREREEIKQKRFCVRQNL